MLGLVVTAGSNKSSLWPAIKRLLTDRYLGVRRPHEGGLYAFDVRFGFILQTNIYSNSKVHSVITLQGRLDLLPYFSSACNVSIILSTFLKPLATISTLPWPVSPFFDLTMIWARPLKAVIFALVGSVGFMVV